MRTFCTLLFVLSSSIFGSETGLAAETAGRFALAIGNREYPDRDKTLNEVVNDTRGIADELKRDHFDVEVGINLTTEDTRQALDRRLERRGPAQKDHSNSTSA